MPPITLTGLSSVVTPDNLNPTTLPFANLGFTGLVGATTYTLTITLSDQMHDYALIRGGTTTFGVLTITDTGANLAADLRSVHFELQEPWEFQDTVPVTLTFALTSPSSISLGSEGVSCFAAGTRILTACGEVPVEHLCVGDYVVTARAGGRVAPVRWIGRRRLAPPRHPRPWDVSPIRIRADALGPGKPSRDLWLSPDHALFLDGMLVRARDLLNGATVVQEAVAEITYFHIDLDRHDVLLAEGVPAESYLDTGNRAAFENGGVAVVAHADFSRAVWERDACAPLVWQGPALAAVRARLVACAENIGWALTEQPDLHLTAQDWSIRPTAQAGALTFDLPAGAGTVCLRSRSTVPAHVLPDAIDTRVLGVAVTRLALDGTPVSLDNAALGAGWLQPEPRLRWTNGAALLRVDGARQLKLRIADVGLPYWLAPSAHRPADCRAA